MMDEEILKTWLIEGEKRAYVIKLFQLLSYSKTSKEVFSFKIMKEKLISDHFSFILEDKNNFLFEMFDKRMIRFVESGIAMKIVENFTTIKQSPDENTDSPITMGHLNVWFISLLCGLLIATFAFFIEIIFNIFEILLKRK